MLPCTYKYETSFQGFGKPRPLKLSNPDSQEKLQLGDKIAYRITFTGLGLTMRDYWTIMKCLAKEVANDLRKNPPYEPVLRCRLREIGEDLRYDDSFINKIAKRN